MASITFVVADDDARDLRPDGAEAISWKSRMEAAAISGVHRESPSPGCVCAKRRG
jgi:hypothetical protein